MQDARAAIVLATPNAKRRDADDAANIMQAISLKARKKTLRVVVQLHNFRNKVNRVQDLYFFLLGWNFVLVCCVYRHTDGHEKRKIYRSDKASRYNLI